MSSTVHGANLIVEWSPRKITTFDVSTGVSQEFEPTAALPFTGKTAILAISRKSIFVRATRVPNAAPEELRMVVQVKLAELFPLPPNDLAYDYMLLSEVNNEGRLALIMAMPVLELRRAHEKMAASGIKIAKTLPLALASTLIAESVGVTDAAVVEGNSEFASVDLVSAGVLRYSRVIPPGAPLDVEVNRTYNAAGLSSQHMVAAGGIDFAQADKLTRLTSLQAMATAGADKFRVNIELPEVVAARDLAGRRKRALVAVAFFAISASALYWSYSNFADLRTKQTVELDKYNKQLTITKKYQTDAEAEQKRQDAITQVLTAAFKPAQNVSDMATLAGNCLPTGVWLSGLNVERGKEMTIRGSSMTNDGVSQYVDGLNSYTDKVTNTPRFRNAKFLFANDGAVQKTPVVDFSISAFPIGNLPIALQQKSGAPAATH